MKNFMKAVSICLFILFVLASRVLANNLSVSDVEITDRNPSDDTITVSFNISWENSWRTKFNHDAVWLTVRLYDPAVSPTNKKLCQLSANGLNPSGTEVGSNLNLEISVPSDKFGAFLRPSNYGVNRFVSSTEVQLTVDYSTCGFGDDDNVYVSVSGVEMVYVPEGPFNAGDFGTGTASLIQGSGDTDPWEIDSESEINVSDVVSDGYYYVSNGNSSENDTGDAFSIPEDFPKGFGDFYAMKYEITEGQWVEFVNSLSSSSARANRDVTNASHKNSDSVIYRNTISCSGSPLTCTTSRPSRAMTYVSWMDLAAYLDWMALRPMTELEYEKLSRGSLQPVSGEFSWGTTDIAAAASLSSGDEDGSEAVTTSGANAHFNSVILTGGDTESGSDYAQGAVRSGIFAAESATRVTSGGSYYGIMDLSGNVYESVVTVGNPTGRIFRGNNGDGLLSAASGYEGNANQASWPGLDTYEARGVTGALGSGVRGGAWTSASSELRISDRTNAAAAVSTASNNTCGRGVRSYGESY